MPVKLLKILLRAARFPLMLLSVIWLIQLTTVLEGISFRFMGIYPLTLKGVPGVLLSPFVHGDLAHASNNSLPLLFLGTALHFAYPKIAYRFWLFATLFTGLWVWLAARPAYHIGASGVIYALFGFLFVRGLISKQRRLMGLCLLVAFLYGGMVWGVFPVEEHISWEGHMFGLMAGISLAFYFRHEDEPVKPKPWDIIGEDQYISDAEAKFGYRYWEGNHDAPTPPNMPPVQIIYHLKEDKKKSPTD